VYLKLKLGALRRQRPRAVASPRPPVRRLARVGRWRPWGNGVAPRRPGPQL